jgi:hypothetical protein
MTTKQDEAIYLTFDQATDLVDRIAARTEHFNYTMSDPEKEAMANLLSEIGVLVNDLIDVSRLADNYAINAEIVTDSEATGDLREALFSWKDNGETYYCLSW